MIRVTSLIFSGLSCICQPGYRYLKNFGGTAVNCTACPAGQVSKRGYCINPLHSDGLSLVYPIHIDIYKYGKVYFVF